MYKGVKIAFLSNQIGFGGGSKSLLLLLKAISQFEFKIYLFVTHCASNEMKLEYEKYVEFVRIIELPELISAQTQTKKSNEDSLRFNPSDSEKIFSFSKELNNLSIEILHINSSVFSPVYEIVKKTTKVKIVSHIREWIDWNGIHEKQEYIINSIKAYSDVIIAISNTESQVFQDFDNLYIIPNPFDFNELENIEKDTNKIKQKLDIELDKTIIGMVGSFQRNKGSLDFLKSIAYLKGTNFSINNSKFIIVGGEIKKPNFIKLCIKRLLKINSFSYEIFRFMKKEDLFDYVIFISKRKNVLEIMNCFDIAVRPSLSGDPWGRDIIEYMALRKPIIATGTSQFFINDGKTGFLVGPGEYKDLAKKINWLCNNEKQGTKMGNLAHDFIYAKCSMEAFRFSIQKVYSSVLKTY